MKPILSKFQFKQKQNPLVAKRPLLKLEDNVKKSLDLFKENRNKQIQTFYNISNQDYFKAAKISKNAEFKKEISKQSHADDKNHLENIKEYWKNKKQKHSQILNQLEGQVNLHFSKENSSSDESQDNLLNEIQRNQCSNNAILQRSQSKRSHKCINKASKLEEKMEMINNQVNRRIYLSEEKYKSKNIRLKSSKGRENSLKRLEHLNTHVSEIEETRKRATTISNVLLKQNNLCVRNAKLLQIFNDLDNKNSLLRQLCLSKCQITDRSLDFLLIKMEKNHCLKKVDLGFNQLTNGSKYSLEKIIKNYNLQILIVKWNKLTAFGLLQAIKSITESVSLLEVDLSYNNLFQQYLPSKQHRKTQTGQNDEKDLNRSITDHLCLLLQTNIYLLHLNLEMCQLSLLQCRQISYVYNFCNHSIIGLHFKGNCSYYTNKLGYLTFNSDLYNSEEQRERFITAKNDQQKQKNALHQQLLRNQLLVAKLQSHQTYQKQNLFQKANILTTPLHSNDCCWICERWIEESFQVEVNLQEQAIQLSQQSETNSSKGQLYIHMNCYNYTPIKMQKVVFLQKTMRKFFQTKKTLSLNHNTIESMDQQSNNKNGSKDNEDNDKDNNKKDKRKGIQSYSLNIAIPINQNLLYFYTYNNIVLDAKGEHKVCFNKEIKFQLFHPLKDSLHSFFDRSLYEADPLSNLKHAHCNRQPFSNQNQYDALNRQQVSPYYAIFVKEVNVLTNKDILIKIKRKVQTKASISSDNKEENIILENFLKFQTQTTNSKSFKVNLKKRVKEMQIDNLHLYQKYQKLKYLSNIEPRNTKLLYPEHIAQMHHSFIQNFKSNYFILKKQLENQCKNINEAFQNSIIFEKKEIYNKKKIEKNENQQQKERDQQSNQQKIAKTSVNFNLMNKFISTNKMNQDSIEIRNRTKSNSIHFQPF